MNDKYNNMNTFEITDQIAYDAHYMKENEFIEYYKLFWFLGDVETRERRNYLLSRISKGVTGVLCYSSTSDTLLHKSSLSLLKIRFDNKDERKEINLGRCDTFECVNMKKEKEEVEVDYGIDVKYVLRTFN